MTIVSSTLILYFLKLTFVMSVLRLVLNLKPIFAMIEQFLDIFILNLSKIKNIVFSHPIVFLA